MELQHKWNVSVPEKLFSPKDPNFKYLPVLLHVTILERKRNSVPCRSVVGRFHCILTAEFLYEFSKNRFVFLFGSRTLGVWQFFSAIMECILVHIFCWYFCQIYYNLVSSLFKFQIFYFHKGFFCHRLMKIWQLESVWQMQSFHFKRRGECIIQHGCLQKVSWRYANEAGRRDIYWCRHIRQQTNQKIYIPPPLSG